ncbi:MAG: hypothetical protein IT372_08090, partial [Polyangiaceae bacterium]|nr:hypothetical protein [Polyangiaceae bacterium]
MSSKPPPSAPAPPAGQSPWPTRLRMIGLPAVALFGIVYFGRTVHAHYRVEQWLFWRYAISWLCAIAWSVACLAAGHAVLKRLLGRTLPLWEHGALSFAVGVYVFYVAMQLAGLAGLYGPVLFVALPALLFAASARPFLRTARRVVRHVRHHRRRSAPPPLWTFPVAALGLLGLAMVYFSILTPGNVAFDSRWYHLGLAEHYAAAGAARRFDEGYVIGASPHLASFMYTWAFLLPAGKLFDRVELAAHIELVSFLWTLVGIPALVRLLVPRSAGQGSRRSLIGLTWVVRFLFPGVFLYDSSLSVGADHMAAIFAVPIYTVLLRCWRDLSPRLCVLLSMMLAGAFLTKYTAAITLLAFPVLAVLARAAWLLVARLRRGAEEGAPDRWAWCRGPLAAFFGGLAFTALHWGKNWIYYGDPLYPLFHRRLALRPWTADSSERWIWGYMEEQFWSPDYNWAGLTQSIKALWYFSFEPNDWVKFHGKVPVFGSLFTLLLLCVPLLRGTRRLWAMYGAAHLGLFCWYWVHHQDRYLQTLMPWMAAATACVIVLAWRAPTAARLPGPAIAALRAPLLGLLALQVIWGGDVYFIPGHAMIKSPIKVVADLLSSGYRKDFKSREDLYEPFTTAAKHLPRGSKVVVHENHPQLGLEAMTVNDFSINQGGISYGLLGTPRGVYDLLKGLGVTHLLWVTERTRGFETLAGDLLFYDFATNYGAKQKDLGSWMLVEMPAAPPPEDASDVVLAATCGKPAAGLHHMRDLNVPVFGPRKSSWPAPFKRPGAGGLAELAPEAAYLIVETNCREGLGDPVSLGFKLLTKRKGGLDLWARPRR